MIASNRPRQQCNRLSCPKATPQDYRLAWRNQKVLRSTVANATGFAKRFDAWVETHAYLHGIAMRYERNGGSGGRGTSALQAIT